MKWDPFRVNYWFCGNARLAEIFDSFVEGDDRLDFIDRSVFAVGGNFERVVNFYDMRSVVKAASLFAGVELIGEIGNLAGVYGVESRGRIGEEMEIRFFILAERGTVVSVEEVVEALEGDIGFDGAGEDKLIGDKVEGSAGVTTFESFAGMVADGGKFNGTGERDFACEVQSWSGSFRIAVVIEVEEPFVGLDLPVDLGIGGVFDCVAGLCGKLFDGA